MAKLPPLRIVADNASSPAPQAKPNTAQSPRPSWQAIANARGGNVPAHVRPAIQPEPVTNEPPWIDDVAEGRKPDMLAAALWYAEQGIPVFPTSHVDKRPLTSHGFRDATVDPDVIRGWWTTHPDAAVGVPTGEVSGLDVLDFDRPKKPGDIDGLDTLAAMVAEHGELPATWQQTTPSGGRHVIYAWAPDNALKNVTKALPGTDVRTSGGYIVVAPSVMSSGAAYVAEGPIGDPAPMPAHVLDRIRAHAAEKVRARAEAAPAPVAPQRAAEADTGDAEAWARAALDGECGQVASTSEGGRNDQLNRSSLKLGRLVGAGSLGRVEVEGRLLAAALACGLDRPSSVKTIASGMGRGIADPKARPERRAEAAAPARAVAGHTATEAWPAPKPLPSGVLPVDAFDFDMVPTALGPWIADISERMNLNPDGIAVAAISALGAVIGSSVRIHPEANTPWNECANLWGVYIDTPGSKKTPGVEEVFKPLRKLEEKAREAKAGQDKAYKLAVAKHRVMMEGADAKLKQAIKADGRDMEAAQALWDRVKEQEPATPVQTRYVVNDSSYEALAIVQKDNPHGVMFHRDEVASLIKSLGHEGNEVARGFIMEGWSGKSPYTFDRVTREQVHVPNNCLTVFGTSQPEKVKGFVTSALQGDGADGLMQRFQLLVWPAPLKEFRIADRPADCAAELRVQRVFDRLAERREASGDAEYVRLEPEALAVFNLWRKDLDGLCRNEEYHEAVRSHFAKYAKLVPALALINHLVDAGKGRVGKTAMLKAIAFSEYLKSHALKVYGAGLNHDADTARAVLAKIRAGALVDGFSARDIRVKEWAGLKDAAKIKGALDLLEDYGWIAGKTLKPDVGRPTVAYQIHPAARS